MAKNKNRYNNISPELAKLVKWPTGHDGKPLPQVVYQLLNQKKLWEFTAEQTRELVDVHPGVIINARDIITDGFSNEDVEIGYYKTLKQTKNGLEPQFLSLVFDSKGLGFLYVPYVGGKDLFQFCEITNLNKDSVNPSKQMPSIGYLFERVKPEEIAEKQIDTMAEVFRVGQIIMNMPEAKQRILAPKLGLSDQTEAKQLQYEILKKVQADPTHVNDLLDSEQLRIEDEVRKAIGKKLIEFDPNVQGYVVYGSREVLALLPQTSVDKLGDMSVFLASPTGRSARDKIRNLLSANPKAKQVAVAPDEDFGDDEPTAPAAKKAAKGKTGPPPAKAKRTPPPPRKAKAAATEPALPALPEMSQDELADVV